ncbi:MAG: 50S ribosomal protein L11 methyltransferase [Nitrospinae bacterium]|nr:50S ribosomal protein L11 methyltransferase [Nitrospinota bacterium]
MWTKIEITVPAEAADEAGCVMAMELGASVEIQARDNDMAAIIAWVKEDDASGLDVPSLAARVTGEPLGGAPAPVVTIEPDCDWLAKWKESFTPLPMGEKLMIVPSWWEGDIPGGRTVITLDPGMAFGTGHHATTAGCLAMLEKYSKGSVLDIGCGSGILSIAAVALGAEKALGLDNDPEVIPIAVENVAINGAAGKVEAALGSIADAKGVYDVIVANIFLGPLAAMAGELASRLAESGRLIISGIRKEQTDAAGQAFTAAGLVAVDRMEKDEWAVIVYARR